MTDPHAPPLKHQPSEGRLHIDRLLPTALSATRGTEEAVVNQRAPGAIGMTHCPGRSRPDARGRPWQRDLAQDVHAIHAAGFATVLTLVDDAELAALGAAGLGPCLQQAGLQWLRLPIRDFGVPDAAAQQAWRGIQAAVLARLAAGESVLVHCAAGLGRTGTMVAVLLKAMGDPADTAIARVRAARPGTIETAAQADFVRGFVP